MSRLPYPPEKVRRRKMLVSFTDEQMDAVQAWALNKGRKASALVADLVNRVVRRDSNRRGTT